MMGRAICALAAAAVLVLAGYGVTGWAQSAPATQPATKPADDGLLLLDDESGDAEQNPLKADNSRCHVCHLNFAMEELSVKHAKAGVGCAKCHGESDAHIDDESWARGGNGTAPDKMYTADTINPGCNSCHEATFNKDIHKKLLAGQTEQKQCTQCHGAHRMVNRKCKWK